MPQVPLSKLINKSVFVTTKIPIYKVEDINNNGDKSKPVGSIKRGYSFVLDSYLSPTEAYTNQYGLKYAKRSDMYFTFFGNDKKYYAVKYAPDGRFSWSKLQEQGVTTTQQDIKSEEEANKSPLDKLQDLFGEAGKTIKTLLFIGVAVFAVGYLVPKFKK